MHQLRVLTIILTVGSCDCQDQPASGEPLNYKLLATVRTLPTFYVIMTYPRCTSSHLWIEYSLFLNK